MVAVVPIDPWMHRQRPALLRMMALTESPAEALLLPALLALGGPDAHFFGPAGIWALEAQVTIPTGGRTYRVDFAATRGAHRVAIEVDGWATHHATDAQEAYDACRDWALGQQGWVVVRLDAWRVFRDPMGASASVAESVQQVECGACLPAGPARTSQNEDAVDRLKSGGLSADEENDILRDLFAKRAAAMGIK